VRALNGEGAELSDVLSFQDSPPLLDNLTKFGSTATSSSFFYKTILLHSGYRLP
jgi:hypothetical protein